MASQKDVQDVQDLLRLLTTGRNKLPMMEAMGRVKALQTAGLKSISDIAGTDLPTLSTALSDEKAAKSLLAACNAQLKSPSNSKRPSDSSISSSTKRQKSAYSLTDTPQTPHELEQSLSLPQPSSDEEAIAATAVYTNRAPLVLAFAVQLLKYTMPEQPLSSRLSLAQALVNVNSRSKAVSIGLEKERSAEEMGWGGGQPKVRVMGREISVLKRSGYEWGDEELAENQTQESNSDDVGKEKELGKERDYAEDPDTQTQREDLIPPSQPTPHRGTAPTWTVSAPVTLKKSTFIARSIPVSNSTHAKTLLKSLISSSAHLQTATHHVTALRVQPPNSHSVISVISETDDDGETGGGSHLLSILESANKVNTLLLVSRWYGGQFLGPDRWRIMTDVSRDALSQRLRVAGVLGQEALWGLDLEAMRSKDGPVTGGTGSIGGMPIYNPDSARSYILKAFASPPAVDANSEEGSKKAKKKTGPQIEKEKEENLSLLLGALDLLFKTWVEYIGRDELDRRAWGWYVQVRPEVASGVAGWGGKGEVKLGDILALRRKG